jgi:hypothetical protein
MAEDQKENFELCRKLVEGVIQELGLDPEKNRREAVEPGRQAWQLRRGSAAVYVFLDSRPDSNYLQVVSPVMRFDEARALPLFRRLLELNSDALFGLAFGIKGDQVLLSSDRSTQDIDRSEVKWMISNVGRVADHFDDKLIAEFGGVKQRENVAGVK